MGNLKQSVDKIDQTSQNKASWSLIVFIILVIFVIGVAWQFTGDKSEFAIKDKPVLKAEGISEIVVELPELIIEKPDVVVDEVIIESIKDPLPLLDNSDDWLKLKLPEITWRKELLKLIIDEDMVRRFVVFTDNFAQGIVAYEYSPFKLPSEKFTSKIESVSFQKTLQTSPDTSLKSAVQIKKNVWQWNENSSRRFSLYIDLLRSMDSESLVQCYSEIKPLIDEAYNELGYDDDFTNTLQDAITRVLDMELPKSSMELIQPSVTYKFADPVLEALPGSDKLLLRLGKDNLIVMKSILLELYEQLAHQENGVD